MENWQKYGYGSEAEFRERYPNAPKPKKKRNRKWTRSIIRKGKVIAKPEGLTQKYQLEPLYWDRKYPKKTFRVVGVDRYESRSNLYDQ